MVAITSPSRAPWYTPIHNATDGIRNFVKDKYTNTVRQGVIELNNDLVIQRWNKFRDDRNDLLTSNHTQLNSHLSNLETIKNNINSGLSDTTANLHDINKALQTLAFHTDSSVLNLFDKKNLKSHGFRENTYESERTNVSTTLNKVRQLTEDIYQQLITLTSTPGIDHVYIGKPASDLMPKLDQYRKKAAEYHGLWSGLNATKSYAISSAIMYGAGKVSKWPTRFIDWSLRGTGYSIEKIAEFIKLLP